MKATVAGYARARSLPEVFELLAQGGPDAQVIAGGQSLVATLNLRLSEGARLIDINDISELRGIEERDGVLRIGALTRHAELARSPVIASKSPLLAGAAPLIAHAAIRNRGTVGGSLAHADPAAELPACMLALGATIEVRSAGGTRNVPAEAFSEGMFATALEEGEIITAIEVPVSGPDERHSIREFARRSGDYALVGLAAVMRGHDLRLAYFGVGDQPVLAQRAMKILSDGGSVADACMELGGDIDPSGDFHASAAYRLHLAGVLLGRVMDDLRSDSTKKEAV
jgi:aerobic carbon-monoxide dehydrogenase medium subunit